MFRGLHFLWQKKKGGYILTHKIILYRSFDICNPEHKIRNISLKTIQRYFDSKSVETSDSLSRPSPVIIFPTSLLFLTHSNGGNGNRIAGISDYIIWFCCSSLPRIRLLCRCDLSTQVLISSFRQFTISKIQNLFRLRFTPISIVKSLTKP